MSLLFKECDLYPIILAIYCTHLRIHSHTHTLTYTHILILTHTHTHTTTHTHARTHTAIRYNVTVDADKQRAQLLEGGRLRTNFISEEIVLTSDSAMGQFFCRETPLTFVIRVGYK